MAENGKHILSERGKKELEDELADLKVNQRQKNAQDLKEAREQGDLSENAEYDAARDEKERIESRIREIEDILKNSEVVQISDDELDTVQMYTKVRLLDIDMNEEAEYTIVGSQEADLFAGKISNDSPVGGALIGAKVGETVTVETPSGDLDFKVLEVTRA